MILLSVFLSVAELKRKYEKHLARRRRAAHGDFDEPELEEDQAGPTVGGISKAKDLHRLMRKVESLESRLVEATLIRPTKSAKKLWRMGSVKSSAALKAYASLHGASTGGAAAALKSYASLRGGSAGAAAAATAFKLKAANQAIRAKNSSSSSSVRAVENGENHRERASNSIQIESHSLG